MDPIILSIAAIIISVVALVFTEWQAITGHLGRTRPKSASLTLHRVGLEGVLENAGGSTASWISLTLTYAYSGRRKQTAAVGVFGDVPGGQRRRVEDSDDDGNPHILEGEVGEPDGRSGRIFEKRVRADWTDYRAKQRVTAVFLPSGPGGENRACCCRRGRLRVLGHHPVSPALHFQPLAGGATWWTTTSSSEPSRSGSGSHMSRLLRCRVQDRVIQHRSRGFPAFARLAR